jgi:hypothetical protein
MEIQSSLARDDEKRFKGSLVKQGGLDQKNEASMCSTAARNDSCKDKTK